jgi:hypothetical protein
VLLQALWGRLRLKDRLRVCFDHLPGQPIFGPHVIILLLVVHLMLGYRELRDSLRRSREVDHLRSAEVTQGRNSGGKVDQERDRERNEVMDRDARDVDHS